VGWKCAACGAESEEAEPWVCRCGIPNAWVPAVCVGGDTPRAVRADRFEVPETDGIEGTAWGELFTGGKFPCPSSLLVYGAAGCGKTRALLRLSADLRPTLVVSLEMTVGEMVGLADGLRVPRAGLWIVESPEWESEAERVGARLVVVDSAGAVYRPVTLMRRARDWANAHDAIVAVVGHANSRGRAKGDTGLSHWPGVVVEAKPRSFGRVELSCPRKNRYGLTGPNRPKVLVDLGTPQAARPCK
jgi:predicted ATP-dependent serine protease